MASPYRIPVNVYPRLANEVRIGTTPYGYSYDINAYEGAIDFISKQIPAFIGRIQEVRTALDNLIHQVTNPKGISQLCMMGFCVNRVDKGKSISIRVDANMGKKNLVTTNYVYPRKIIYKA